MPWHPTPSAVMLGPSLRRGQLPPGQDLATRKTAHPGFWAVDEGTTPGGLDMTRGRAQSAAPAGRPKVFPSISLRVQQPRPADRSDRSNGMAVQRFAPDYLGPAHLRSRLLLRIRRDAQQLAKQDESVPATRASEGVEKAHEPGIECGQGGSEHEQPAGEAKPVSLPERTRLVEDGKGHRPHRFRRCSEAGTSGRHAESKTDGEPDQGIRGRVGVGTLPDRTSQRNRPQVRLSVFATEARVWETLVRRPSQRGRAARPG